MSTTTTNAIEKTLNNVNEIYASQGFGSGASGYIVILTAVLFILGSFFIIKRNQKKSEELQDKLFVLFEQSVAKNNDEVKTLNSSMLEEIKNITLTIRDGMESMTTNVGKSSEAMYALIENNNDRLVEVINSEKKITLLDFEKQCKVLMELSLLRMYESFNSRLEKNDLVKLKCDLIGSETECHKDSEIFSIIRKFGLECKTDIKNLNFNNEVIKNKVFDKYSMYLNELNIKVCDTFDVDVGYCKDLTGRAVRNVVFSTLNGINDLNFDNL